MAQDISIWGATYEDVAAVELPKSGGGTATFTDVSDTTADASEVISGKVFYSSGGVRSVGTYVDQDTTYSDFTGATTSAGGTSGLVPAPATQSSATYLARTFISSDGIWRRLASLATRTSDRYSVGIRATNIATETYYDATSALLAATTSYAGVMTATDKTNLTNLLEGNIPFDTSASSGTTDGDLYAALVNFGWDSDCIV